MQNSMSRYAARERILDACRVFCAWLLNAHVFVYVLFSRSPSPLPLRFTFCFLPYYYSSPSSIYIYPPPLRHWYGIQTIFGFSNSGMLDRLAREALLRTSPRAILSMDAPSLSALIESVSRTVVRKANGWEKTR